MKKIEDIKGFTLVELLVTMVILSIITAMAFPLVRKISQNNTEKKYKTYANSLEKSAKLYVDSYKDDLFNNNKSLNICITYKELHNKSLNICITYKELHNKLLAKDIEDNNLSCNSNKTFVQVIKENGIYKYKAQLGCGKKKASNSELIDNEITINYPSNNDLICDVTI